MTRAQFLISAAAIVPACMALSANAQFASIRTNSNGADAELRESELNFDPITNIAQGNNRGSNSELATRVRDSVVVDNSSGTPVISNPFPSNDRSSISMVKFDISSLPNHNVPGFWEPESKVQFHLYVRNANNFNNLFGENPSTMEEVNLRMRVRALDPTKVYADDNPAAAARTDRSGNPYVASENKYNWDESGVTFYNAPGITPHNVMGPTDNAVQTLGIYDDFNSDTLDLGTFTPRDFLPDGQSALPQGSSVFFDGDSLKNLIFAAQDANRSFVTLFVHIDNDPTLHQPEVNIFGETPQGMLNRNYLFTPKELLSLGAGLDNSGGAFSPELRVVPEPGAAMFAGAAAVGLIGRRRRR